jgi:hypothetical protein
MPHKFEIIDRKILLDSVDITETVLAWSASFSQDNLMNSGNTSPFCVVLRRAVYVKETPMTDDSGVCTYNQILNDVDIEIKIDGKVSKIQLASGPLPLHKK